MKRRTWVVACMLASVLAAGASAAARSPQDAGAAGARGTTGVSSCTSATIGIMAPLTGPGTQLFLGTDQLHWVQLFVDRWNKRSKPKIQLVWGDTRGGAAAVAKRLARNAAVLGVVGPATASHVRAAGPVFKRAGLAMVSASALQTSPAKGSLTGVFFRVVPGAATEAPTDAAYMIGKLGVKKGDTVMVVDDGQAYSKGFAGAVSKPLRAAGVTVDQESVSPSQTDFSSLIDKIGARTKVVFLPLPPAAAQAFGQQMSNKGKSAILFGTQRTFELGTFTFDGSYVSFFAPNPTEIPANAAIVRAFTASYGVPSLPPPFGAPAYAAAEVLVDAVAASCKRAGKVSRSLVRQYVAKTKIARSILGMPIAFAANGDLEGGKFWIYKVVKGTYVLQTS